MMKNLVWTLLICICVFALSCPSVDNSRRALKPTQTAPDKTLQSPQEVSENLLELTPMGTDYPTNVELNRAGDMLLFNILHTKSTQQFVVSTDFVNGQLLNAREIHLDQNLAKAFLSSHPNGDRGLILRNYQEPGQPVIDQLIEIELGKSARTLRYEDTSGISTNVQPDDKYGIQPFFSWDGEIVVIPLKYSGIVVYDLINNKRNFVPYPPLDYPRTGKSIKALEDQNGKRRVLISVWAQEVFVDSCKLYTLDLDTLETREIADLKWVAYSAGCTDYDNEPWIVTGSRGREKPDEIKRTPLLFMLDPSGSSAAATMQFYGDPRWQVEVSTHGDKVVYLDEQRKAIVRLTPMTGEMEIDRNHFNENGKLLVSADGSKVFIWERDELYAADFTETESFPPYDQE